MVKVQEHLEEKKSENNLVFESEFYSFRIRPSELEALKSKLQKIPSEKIGEILFLIVGRRVIPQLSREMQGFSVEQTEFYEFFGEVQSRLLQKMSLG
ncbi:MAG: hypothetical protein Q8R15_00740 [Candidatus Micrarchaeota archaeon]|nr:hypothetical protein [Candidatus Micrarchaeota archaeon]